MLHAADYTYMMHMMYNLFATKRRLHYNGSRMDVQFAQLFPNCRIAEICHTAGCLESCMHWQV